MSDIIVRYLSQRCIGYLRDERGCMTHSVYECIVRYRDGRTATVVESHTLR